MRLIVFFSFLLISLSLGAMDYGKRNDSVLHKLAGWGGGVANVFFTSAAGRENVTKLPVELINSFSKELRKQVEDGGDLNATVRAFCEDVASDLINEIGEELNSQAQSIGGELGEQVRSVGGALDKQVQDILGNVGKKLGNEIGRLDGQVLNSAKQWSKLTEQWYERAILITVLGAASVICTWYGGKVLSNHIDRKLQKPKVIIRSSHENLWRWCKKLGQSKKQPIEMVFPQKLGERLNRMINVTKHISKHIQRGKKGVKYRNILLYGPPGTGKTMFARKLACESGMEFAELTGSSLFQKGAGITAIDDLFSWAKKSKKGLCLFIDEADSLFVKRDRLDPASENYRMVNHILNYLGERSDKFMVIMATNRHRGWDEAMHRRIDDAIEMPLPGNQERYAALKLYRQTVLHDQMILRKEEKEKAFDKTMQQCGTDEGLKKLYLVLLQRQAILRKKGGGRTFGTSVQQYLADEKLKEVADKTENFSYGDMQGIINKLKTDAFTTEDGLLNPQLIDEVVQEYKEKYEAFVKKSS